MQTIRVIKKYPNRRLYDTELNAYITLEDIKQLVFDHVNFQVIDARTKKDLTQSTLLQIITEQEANANPIFTTQMLQDFIRLYHEKSQTLVSQYLEKAMDLFVKQKDYMKKQWDSYENLLLNPNLFEEMIKMQKWWLKPDDTKSSEKPQKKNKK